MIVEKELVLALQSALKACYEFTMSEDKLALQPTHSAFSGTHTFVLFPLAGQLKKAPAEIGETLGAWLKHNSSLVFQYEVAQGFLNITLADHVWLSALAKHMKGDFSVKDKQKIIIEIACPNTNKPLHLGHLRNSVIGDAVANILQAVGHEVKKLMHVNDRGVHICQSMWAYQQEAGAPTPADKKVKGDHFVGQYYVKFNQQYKRELAALEAKLGDKALARKQTPSVLAVQKLLKAWEAGDKEVLALWKKMNSWVLQGFNETFSMLGLTFDKEYYESDTYLLGKTIVEQGYADGLFYKKEDGAIWVDLTEEGLDQKLLLRGDGTAVYLTQDIGTADIRDQDFQPDRSIYVVGDEQKYHFEVLFAVLKRLQRPYADNLYHLAYGMVDLPSGKMKSREGTVVDADGLLKEMLTIATEQTKKLGKTDNFTAEELQHLYHTLAIGALKFFLVQVNPQKRMLFDPAQSIDFQGKTGSFIQYTHARMATLLEKAEEAKHIIPTTFEYDNTVALHPTERALVVHMVSLCEVLQQAAADLNPASVAQYFYTLAKLYNQFYAALPILQAATPALQHKRLYLSYCAFNTLKRIAFLLGISLPKRM